MESCGISLPVLVILVIISTAHGVASQRALNNNTKASAILVFGDSTVDSGNNDYVKTVFKGNYPPYGRDFPDQIPTGRFSNGRLVPDFLASYTGVKDYVPPYLDPTLSIQELMSGVNFASAGTGFDPLTASLSNVIQIQRQLEYFKEYKRRLESVIGKQRTQEHVENALILVSCGTNDFIVNYFTVPIRRKSFTVSSYQQFLIQLVRTFLQSLVEEGGRRILFAGLPPIGCIPIVITFNGHNPSRNCIDSYSSVARTYNTKLQAELNLIQSELADSGARIRYTDIYGPLNGIIQGYEKLGFEDATTGCCGTGYVEAGFLCNPKYVCSDASKYVFWDSFHPTEKSYYYIFQAIRPTVDQTLRQ